LQNQLTVRGLALSKYKTISGFADAVGWSRSKATRVLNDLDKASLSDIKAMCNALSIQDPAEIVDIFFC